MSQAKVHLEVTTGPMAGRVFSFDSHNTFIFGRHRECHARITRDPNVSRHHFLLEVNPPDACLRDLGSLNGTIVNEVKCGGRDQVELDASGAVVHPNVSLTDGDNITVGTTTILVKIVDPPICSACGEDIPADYLPESRAANGRRLCESCQGTSSMESPSIGNQDETRDLGPPDRLEETTPPSDSSQNLSRESEAESEADDPPTPEKSAGRGGFKSIFQAAKKQREKAQQPPEEQQLSISGYTIGRELGRGGMGVVYHAVRDDGVEAAVKVMLAKVAVDELARKNFVREIKVMAAMRHENIARLLDCGAAGTLFYCVVEYCSGGNFHQVLEQKKKPLPLNVAKPLFLQALSGLAYAHNQSVVHRDLKPQNVLVHKENGQYSAKLCDFGLAKNFEQAGLSGLTATGDFAGTYRFMPREQLTDFRFVQPVSDVWSIAATFYYMLTQEHPLHFPPERDPMEVLLRDDAISLGQRDSDIPTPITEVIDQALVTDKDKRYQTAGEFRGALQQAFMRIGM